MATNLPRHAAAMNRTGFLLEEDKLADEGLSDLHLDSTQTSEPKNRIRASDASNPLTLSKQSES